MINKQINTLKNDVFSKKLLHLPNLQRHLFSGDLFKKQRNLKPVWKPASSFLFI